MAFKTVLIAVCLVFLITPVFSQEVFVALNPVSHSFPVEVYESELVEYELVVINTESIELKNFNALILVDSELAIVVNGKEKKEHPEIILSLKPNSTVKKQVIIKGISFSTKPLEVKVKYGFEKNYVHSYSTTVIVAKSPLTVNARLEKTALEPLEQNNLLLDLTNTSNHEIKNISANLTVPQGFVDNSQPLVFPIFAKEQSVLKSAFLFVAPNEPVGEKIVTLTINYEDQTGFHVINKNLFVDVRNRDQFLLLMGAIIIVLLILSFFVTSRKKSQVTTQTDSSEKEPVKEQV